MALRIDFLNKELATLDVTLIKDEDGFTFEHGASGNTELLDGVEKINDWSKEEWMEAAKQFVADSVEEEEGDEEEEEPLEMSDILAKYRHTYVKTTKADGRVSMDKGDEVAEALRSLSLGEVLALADIATGATFGTHAERYQGLNLGSQRMNAGNRIRAAVRKQQVDLKAILGQLGNVGQTHDGFDNSEE